MSKYILCDIEATGNRDQDRIIQLGLMVFENSIDTKPVYMSNELNSTMAEMMSEAMEIHNITPEMLVGRKLLYETNGYRKLCELNKIENIFIAHDAPSDMKMLGRESFNSEMTVIDTLRCARHLFEHLDAHRLQFLRYELGLYRDEDTEAEKLDIDLKAHDAISDVLVMKILLSRLMVEVKKQFGLTKDIEIFDKLIELSRTPVFIKKFKFGKYKGEYIDEVANSDYGYISWMRNTLKLDDDMKHTLDYYL